MTEPIPPTREECLSLLAAAGAPAPLLNHVVGVAAAAAELARRTGADAELCSAAALLHDIGKAPGASRLLTAALTAGDQCPTGLTGPGEAEPVRAAGAGPGAPYPHLGHDAFGARLLRALGGQYACLAGIVERHAVDAVLRAGSRPGTLEEKIVFLADKMVGGRWLGFEGRIEDLLKRYGHRFDTRLCVPGCDVIRLEVAAAAALGWHDLEGLVAAAVALPVIAHPCR